MITHIICSTILASALQELLEAFQRPFPVVVYHLQAKPERSVTPGWSAGAWEQGVPFLSSSWTCQARGSLNIHLRP